MPTPRQIAEPAGLSGAVEAYIAPLQGGDRTLLDRPIEMAAYIISSIDKKSLIRLTVMHANQRGFSGPDVADSAWAIQHLSDDKRMILRAAWHTYQLSVESYHPDVIDTVNLLTDLANRIATLTDGVISDSLSQRYFSPGEIGSSQQRASHIFPKDVVSIMDTGERVQTMGMSKFDLPDFAVMSGLTGEANLDFNLISPLMLAVDHQLNIGQLKAGSKFLDYRIELDHIKEAGVELPILVLRKPG